MKEPWGYECSNSDCIVKVRYWPCEAGGGGVGGGGGGALPLGPLFITLMNSANLF